MEKDRLLKNERQKQSYEAMETSKKRMLFYFGALKIFNFPSLIDWNT